MKLPSTAPGMLAFVGSSGAIYPEDYNEAGSIWDHFDRNDIDFFNFGLGFELAPGIETQEFKYTGFVCPSITRFLALCSKIRRGNSLLTIPAFPTSSGLTCLLRSSKSAGGKTEANRCRK